MLNKSKGNMYPWVTHTWNVIKGKCPHDCSYCYMKRYPQKELYFDNKAINDNLGQGNIIFIGSSTDMWAKNVAFGDISTILSRCRDWDNEYLFQSKNPSRFIDYCFPAKTILGSTIESNRYYPEISKAIAPAERKLAYHYFPQSIKTMVSIEPIMDFDLDILTGWIKDIKPQFVSIGADSGNNHLPEPSGDKLKALIESLKTITEVKLKDNLCRLLK